MKIIIPNLVVEKAFGVRTTHTGNKFLAFMFNVNDSYSSYCFCFDEKLFPVIKPGTMLINVEIDMTFGYIKNNTAPRIRFKLDAIGRYEEQEQKPIIEPLDDFLEEIDTIKKE